MSETITDQARGDAYEQTIGRILDYPALAAFLIDRVRIHELWDHFLDVPCGTGRLLSRLIELCPALHAFGVDSSDEQLAVAASRLSSVSVRKGDIFMSSEVTARTGFGKGFCHVGFCFFNTFNPENRQQLLRQFAGSETVTIQVLRLHSGIGSCTTSGLSRDLAARRVSEDWAGL